ncbi:hypothetical protein [Bythopirellula goksoeyrii]|uniref:Uncharacterized protein n=1 Tax=Bythopirellula goksoeyrii TaxID=1400387 RepID=A0A5B9Q7Y6_9BACT|nr:hypothetical protein [Bythopirellula goksoeyrii]QEG33769.1 hypothetical protein Pr1d_10390 [Bythopirellula goksoeyrii]
MTTKNLFVMFLLAILTVASLNATVMAQGTSSSRAQFTRIAVRGITTPKLARQAAKSFTFEESSQALAQYKQWMIGANNTGKVTHGLPKGPLADAQYNLKGLVPRKFLQYEKQGTFGGINLGWTDNASASTATKSAKWYFVATTDGSAPVVGGSLHFGDPIALAWGSGKKPYVKYSKRNVGINLNWSSKPSFEWAVLGGVPGSEVRRGEDVVILFNLKHRQPMMYFDRTVGGHIGWPDSRTWNPFSGSLTSKNPKMPAVVLPLLQGNWEFKSRLSIQ